MRLLDFDRDAYELQTTDLIVLFSYTKPIAYYSRSKEQHYQTEENLSMSSKTHLEKWLRSRNAIGKTTKIPQYSIETNCDPEALKVKKQ
jgi:hypothetical protein